ncbi:hypothetical protein F5Y14DRAFT_420476 [Nemania sp. NC0429]|nr:hypothetical protein F5Y14DRAFT_420476 [Nemania sp. NC0429]
MTGFQSLVVWLSQPSVFNTPRLFRLALLLLLFFAKMMVSMATVLFNNPRLFVYEFVSHFVGRDQTSRPGYCSVVHAVWIGGEGKFISDQDVLKLTDENEMALIQIKSYQLSSKYGLCVHAYLWVQSVVQQSWSIQISAWAIN